MSDLILKIKEERIKERFNLEVKLNEYIKLREQPILERNISLIEINNIIDEIVKRLNHLNKYIE